MSSAFGAERKKAFPGGDPGKVRGKRMCCGTADVIRFPHEHFNLEGPQAALRAAPPYNTLNVGQYLQSKYCGRKQ